MSLDKKSFDQMNKIIYKMNQDKMDLQDKLNEWSTQLEQAQEYGLMFDWQTVKEMIEVIKDLTK